MSQTLQVVIQGGALGVLVLFLIGLALAGRFIFNWVAPRVDKILDSHIALVTTLRNSLPVIEKNIVLQTGSLNKIETGMPQLCRHALVINNESGK